MALRNPQACNSNCRSGDHGADCACPCKGCRTAAVRKHPGCTASGLLTAAIASRRRRCGRIAAQGR
eukprot:6144138-Alexandrium_andersonii.AAC.1